MSDGVECDMDCVVLDVIEMFAPMLPTEIDFPSNNACLQQILWNKFPNVFDSRNADGCGFIGKWWQNFDEPSVKNVRVSNNYRQNDLVNQMDTDYFLNEFSDMKARKSFIIRHSSDTNILPLPTQYY